MKNIIVCFLLIGLFACKEKKKPDFTTTFERSKGLETATYNEVIELYQQEKFTEAEELLHSIEQIDGLKWLEPGIASDKNNVLKEAETYYSKAINDNQVNAMYNLAVIYESLERWDKAERYYLMAVERHHPDAIFNFAMFCMAQGKWGEAEKYYLMAASDHDDYQEIGATEIATKYSRNGVRASGYDIGVSLLRTQMLNLGLDAQFSKLSKNDLLALDNPTANYEAGSGFAIGVEADFKFIANTVYMNARIERQWYGDNYIPQFFNFAYEINKDARLQELLTATKSQGIFGTLTAEILKTIKIGGSLLIPDDIDSNDPTSRKAILGLDLETKQIGKFKARGTYVKAGLNDLGDAFSLDERSLANLIVTYKINKFMEAGVDYQWTFAENENGVFKAINQVRPYVGVSIDF